MKFRKLWIFSFILSTILVTFVFAQNVNKLEIVPNVSTGRYYCPVSISVWTQNNWANHTNCQYLIDFDTWNVWLSYLSRWSAFNSTDTVYYTWINSNILAVEEKNNSEISTGVICSNLTLTNKTSYPGSVFLKFVDFWWNDPTESTFLNTNDKLNLSLAGADTLTWVVNLDIPFEMCPCILDSQAPFADTSTFSHPSINGWQLLGQNTVSVLFVDDWGSAWNYRYADNTISTGNYTNVWLPLWMDNQEWANSGTISVLINYSDLYGVSDQFIDIASLSATKYTGTIANRPELTRDNNDRWYWISFLNDTDYAVERPVTITISWYDNALVGNLPCVRSAILGNTTYTFNNYQVPTMTNFSPANGDVFQNPGVSPITLEVRDTWAGVDTGKVWITIPEIMSWWQVLLTGYTYSGTDLIFSWISWTPGLWNSGWYLVSFVPKWIFPTNTWINLTWMVIDLAWYTWTASWSFTTRPDCSFYWCNEILNIYIMTWSYFNWGLPWQFTWELLIITWTNPNSPYPYLTWVNNDILMCGFPYNWTELTWNINIYSADGITIINWDNYTGTELYVTWLDFTYNNWVITVN